MSDFRSLPKFATHAEAKRAIWFAASKFSHCRIGQAVCNHWNLDKELETLIYELDNHQQVANIVIGYQHTKDELK